MQDTQPIGQALAATHCNEDTTSRQSPSKRKARIQSQSKQGNGSSQTTPSSRYTRSQAAPDWTVQEVLVLLSEIVSIDEVWLKELSSYQRWKMISDSCIAMNVVRSSNQCKRKWEILLDDYKKIINWEPQSREDSYWFLPEERRTDYGLPVSFQKEVFDAMDAVIQIHLQQSDSSNSDPERLINGSEFERSKMNAGSVHEVETITSKCPENALVLAVNELITTSKSTEVEKLILENQEKALVLASGNELITTSKSHEAGELITISKNFTERAEAEELSTSTKNLEERPDAEELITSSKKPDVEVPVTTSNSSEQKLEVQELNTTLKSLEERPEEEELITTSKKPEVEVLVTTSKSSEQKLEVQELNTTSKSLEERPEVEELITTSKSPEKALVMAVSGEEELINTSKSSVVDELITTKSREKASVIPALQNEESTTNSKSSEKTRLITGKLQENAEHVCAILRGDLQDGRAQCPLPADSLKPSVAETELARHQADQLIKALAELTKSLDELSDQINRSGCVGIVPLDSMA